MASALAAGLSLDETDRSGPEATLVKAPLNQIGAPAPFSGSTFVGVEDYSLSSLFSQQNLASVIEINAQSTGNDLIPGLLNHPNKPGCYPNLGTCSGGLGGNWMAINVSFNNDAMGRADSLIRARRNNTEGLRKTPGSDIYSHYFLQSCGIAEALINRTMLEQAAEQISYPGDEDIDGLDFALGVQAYAQQTSPLLFFPAYGKFYFSLAPSCIVDVNSAVTNQFALDQQGGWQPADQTTIYVVEWDQSNGVWMLPEVYLAPSVLGLDKGVDDVDALAVNETGVGSNGTVIFSTAYRPGDPASQLQGYDPNSGASGTLRNSNGRKITRRLGAIDDTDDIDAICIFDPEAGMLGTHMGVPTRLFKSSKQFMGMSVTRGQVGSSQDNLIVQVSGWGAASPTDSSVELMIAVGMHPGQPLSNVNWYSLGKQSRSHKADFVEWIFPIPAGLTLNNAALVAELAVGSTVIEHSVISQFDVP